MGVHIGAASWRQQGTSSCDAVLTSERGGAGGDNGADGGAGGSGDGPLGGVLTLAQIKRFVCYCRAKCAPRLSEEAARTLQSEYVAIRDNARQRAISTGSEEAIPITVRLPPSPFLSRPSVDQNARAAQVRQLEALVRVSEALSKMRLSAEVSSRDVREVRFSSEHQHFPNAHTILPMRRPCDCSRHRR